MKDFRKFGLLGLLFAIIYLPFGVIAALTRRYM